jgi:NAD(P)-dependent dehydrogenase (short-subunit alcohol dehydrogenase family)
MPGSTTDLPLDHQVAVITGGASGIGAAIATSFAAHGAVVAIVDVKEADAIAGAHALGPEHLGLSGDVASVDSVARVAARLQEHFGHVDILVNCAGVVRLAPAELLQIDDWDLTMQVNLRGAFLMSQAIGRMMIARRSGRIVNIASQAARVALDQHVAYCASKAGLVALTRSLASEWAGRGVTVNAISPTVVLTELGRTAWSGPRGQSMLDLIPTGRFAEPDEIAATALFLVSPAAGMINGVDLAVDGGYTIR